MKTLAEKIRRSNPIIDFTSAQRLDAYILGLNQAAEIVENHTCEYTKGYNWWKRACDGEGIKDVFVETYCANCMGRVVKIEETE